MILIEGQIGVGKTTLGDLLEKDFGIPLYRELGNIDTMQILNSFYAEKRRWSFLSQIHFLVNRFSMMINMQRNHQLGFLDRSMFGDSIFAELLYEEGYLTTEEFNTYKTLFDNVLKIVNLPQYLIYLNCSVETAVERISKRGRECEKTISLDYMQKLHAKYDEWYRKYNYSPKVIIETDNINILLPQGKSYILELLGNEVGNLLSKSNAANQKKEQLTNNFFIGDYMICT